MTGKNKISMSIYKIVNCKFAKLFCNNTLNKYPICLLSDFER